MTLNRLNKTDKHISTLNFFLNDLSNDSIIRDKQTRMIQALNDMYIKGCDYSGIIEIKLDKKHNKIYKYKWPDTMTLENLDKLLNDFISRTIAYERIYNALQEEYKNHPEHTYAQTILKEQFTDIVDDWYKHETKYFIDLYNNDKELVKKINDTSLTYFHGM